MNDDSFLNLAREVTEVHVMLKSIKDQSDTLALEIKKVRHELANEKLNKDFKRKIVDDYNSLSEKVETIDGAIKTGGWILRNWKTISVIVVSIFMLYTGTIIDVGDKLLNAEPPKNYKNSK